MSVPTCQSISVIIVNYLIPCLTFNKVVSSIDAKDLKTIGVLLLTAALYQFIGFFFSLLTKTVTPNPKYWMGGLIVAGTFSNAGDLPIAYITTLSSGTLFTSADSSKGIAYCVIFLAIFTFSLFNMGGFRLIERDFRRKSRDIENGIYDPERKADPGLVSFIKSIRDWYKKAESKGSEKELTESDIQSEAGVIGGSNVDEQAYIPESSAVKKSTPEQATSTAPTNIHQKTSTSNGIDDVISTCDQIDLLADSESIASAPTVHDEVLEQTKRQKFVSKLISDFHQFLQKYHIEILWELIKNFGRPPSAALIISIVVIMIPKVRRLFYDAADSTVTDIPNAPDGAPVLGFVMDFASFVGAAAVPLGLAMLGATMARLSIKKLPTGFWKGVLLMSVLKLVVLPIIALAWAGKMKELNWIAKDNYMALFVMIISSGVPTATSQVYLTAIFMPRNSDAKEMDCLAAYLICQYVLLVFTMTILLTYTLKNVLGF